MFRSAMARYALGTTARLCFHRHLALADLIGGPLARGRVILRPENLQGEQTAETFADGFAKAVIQHREVLRKHDRGDLEFPQHG